MKEKIKMRKKYVKIIIGIIIVLIIGFFSNPFWWLMQSSVPQQPKLNKDEVEYFKRFTKNGDIEIKRYYINFTIDGRDTLFVDNYDKKIFDYNLAFFGTKKNGYESIVLEKDSVNKIAKYIRDKILKKNKNLRNIIIWDGHNKYNFTPKEF